MSTDQYPSTAEIRAWARTKRAGAALSPKGRLPQFVILGWNKAHPDRPYVASQSHHGTPQGYMRHRCRCDRCLEAGRAYRRESYHLRADKRNDELSDLLADS
jgi:hypothetical protein